MPSARYPSQDALGLAERVRKGEVSAAELVEEAIARIEKHNPFLNAVVHKMYDEAREVARNQPAKAEGGPLQGVPFLLKDILGDYRGVPTRFGCGFIPAYPAPHDSELVVRYRKAGLIALGKTNTPELGLLPTTEPRLYGPARNPWNTAHSTGGSSGGSAAAVAAGIVPLAHANDGGGSIRIPASCCGLVGMKPTRARNPLGPLIGDIMNGLVVEHVVTRTVRDSAAVLDCTAGPEPGDPYWAPPQERPYLEEVSADPRGLRIAFTKTTMLGEQLHPDCAEAAEAAAKLCEELGHEVEESAPPIDLSRLTPTFMAVWAAGAAVVIDTAARLTGREPTEDQFEPLTWGVYERGRQVSASEYQIAIADFQLVAREVAEFFEEHDAWLTPTLGEPPLRLGVIDTSTTDVDKGFEPCLRFVPFTPIENLTGQPAISLPLHWNGEGLPIGVMFAGRFGDEAILYRLAGQLEKARPWHDRRPPVWD